MSQPRNEGFVRLPGDGETTDLFGDTYTVKAAGDETNSVLAVIEADLAPKSSGTPLHINTLEDENYYIVEGTLTFRISEETIEAPAGSFVHIPRGVVHTHWNGPTRACEAPRRSRSGRFRDVLRRSRRTHVPDAARPAGHEPDRGDLREVRT